MSDQASILTWLKRLVTVDTISSKSNLGLIEMVRDDLVHQGLAPILSYNREGTKANLFVTFSAADGATHGGLVFSGHTDVVPVEGQVWTTPPFTPTLRDGRLYGRGSADMKGFIAVVLALVPKILQLKLAQPLHIALSFDEEVGCLGIQTLLADLAQRGIRPAGCLIGEPTGMAPVIAHKGMHHFRCRLHGCEAHSSLAPRAVNSIEYAARLIGFIRNLMDEFSKNGPFDHAFDVPHTTAQTSSIRGGSAINIVPNLCEFEFEFRNLPEVSADAISGRIRRYADELQKSMRTVHPESLIDIRNLSASPALNMTADDALVQMVCRLSSNPHIAKVAYGTEGGYFVQAGIPAVVCGPGHIAQAHRPDEYIETAQLEQCRIFLEKLLAASSVA